MGPTYLVLLRGGDAAIVLYDGTDEAEARKTYDDVYAEHSKPPAEGVHDGSIILVTVRAEARLS